jgi:hypothetical protein
LAGVDLRAEKIERQMRMSFADLSVVVGPAVMALGKDVDRVDGRVLQDRRKPVGIEIRPDLCDVFRGVKIDVNLAKGEGKHGNGRLRNGESAS